MGAKIHVQALADAHFPSLPLHLAIGMFDGVHLGHRAVIESAVISARRSGGLSAVLTFWPHPSALFRPQERTRLIMDTATKNRVLFSLGVEAVITQPFTHEYAAIEAEEFLPQMKRHLPHLTAVYVGENWRFGQGRRGDIGLLLAEGKKHGVGVFSAPRVNFDGEPISSTRIRALLKAGEIVAANALLGYTYFSEGRIVSGKKLGRKIGFPTLNVAWTPDFQPRLGVYLVQVSDARSDTLRPAVANYGLRPTVEREAQPQLEVHVLGECPWAEGDTITVEWLRFLRPEQKFANIDELKAQIDCDRAQAQALVSS